MTHSNNSEGSTKEIMLFLSLQVFIWRKPPNLCSRNGALQKNTTKSLQSRLTLQGTNLNIPPDGKLGKSSTQKCRLWWGMLLPKRKSHLRAVDLRKKPSYFPLYWLFNRNSLYGPFRIPLWLGRISSHTHPKTSKVLFHCSVEAKAAASMASDPCSHATDHWNVAALRRTSVEAPGPPLPAQGRPSVPSTNLPFSTILKIFSCKKYKLFFVTSFELGRWQNQPPAEALQDIEIWMKTLLSLTFVCQIQIYI